MPSLEKYLLLKLKFTPEQVKDMGQVVIKKANTRTSAKVKNEYVVTFQSSSVRDMVRGSAKNLAGDKDSGMRLHIPGHLEPNFKVLENLSYTLKQRYPALRRNIKFDDPNMDLQLDFMVTEAAGWKSVLPAQARRFAAVPRDDNPANRSVSVGDLSDLATGS